MVLSWGLPQKSVGIINDIETIFYEVLVLENNRCLLKFQDINGKTTFWNFCSSFTGSTSSTNSCNYSLQSKELAVTRQNNNHILQILWRRTSMFITLGSQRGSMKDTAAIAKLHQDTISICTTTDYCFKLLRKIQRRIEQSV